MNSVRTEPRVSLLPYSTRVSSPALKIMHTWGGMGLLHGGKLARTKRKTVEGGTLSVQSDSHFSVYSVPLPISPPPLLYLMPPQPLDTCHPLTRELEGGLMRW